MSVELNLLNANSINNINTNFTRIQTALQDALSRSGHAPNPMNADIDLNDNDLLNVGNVFTTSIFIDGQEFTTSGATARGFQGWSPSLGIVSDGARRVLQLVTWVGGEGSPPTVGVGEYIGVSGFTASIASAVDIRGPQGASGAGTGDMLAAQNLNDVANKATSRTNLGVAIGVDVQAYDAETLKWDVEDQGPATGGLRVTPKDLGFLVGVSITPDPGDRPIQKIKNNGAGSILPGSNYGQYSLLVINETGAGAITTTGWTLKGDTFDTTITSKFLCSCIVTPDLAVLSVVKVA